MKVQSSGQVTVGQDQIKSKLLYISQIRSSTKSCLDFIGFDRQFFTFMLVDEVQSITQ